MTEQMAVEKSLAEQIFGQMFAVIEKRSEFDAQTVERLKAFVARGDLGKAAEVTEAIECASEVAS